MERFQCTDCSEIFYTDDLRIVHERNEPDYTICPCCGSTDYENKPKDDDDE